VPWLAACLAGPASVCLSVSLTVCLCLSAFLLQLLLLLLVLLLGPAFRFPSAPNIYSLTQVCLTHSYEAINICIYISLPPSLPPSLA